MKFSTEPSSEPLDELDERLGRPLKRARAVSPMPGPSSEPLDKRTKTWKHATGFRKDLTADQLVQPGASTRKKRLSGNTQNSDIQAALRVAVKALSPEQIAQIPPGVFAYIPQEEKDGMTEAQKKKVTPAQQVVSDAVEKKKTQNTQAARRSRIRKADEVNKLQDKVKAFEQEIVDLKTRLVTAEQRKEDAIRERNEAIGEVAVLKARVAKLEAGEK